MYESEIDTQLCLTEAASTTRWSSATVCQKPQTIGWSLFDIERWGLRVDLSIVDTHRWCW